MRCENAYSGGSNVAQACRELSAKGSAPKFTTPNTSKRLKTPLSASELELKGDLIRPAGQILVDQLEGRAGVDTAGGVGASERSGLSSTQLGVRYNVLSATDKLPSVAVQTRLLLRSPTEAFRSAGVATSTIVAIGKGVTDDLGLVGNVVFTTGGDAPGTRVAYVLGAS